MSIYDTIKIVYVVVDKESGKEMGTFSRNYVSEEERLRIESSDKYGLFSDQTKYEIQKYRVEYKLIEEEKNG